MVAPTIKLVTTTAKATEPTLFSYTDPGNSEINTTTKLDFGVINIDSDAFSPVKPVWAYVVDMQGNTSIANIGFFVDGLLASGLTHYDKITGTWENPDNTGNQQQVGSVESGLQASNKHTVLRSTGASTMTAAGQHSQYIFTQWKALSTVPTGAKTTGSGSGRAVLAFTYS
jgi:hypothetical protein